MDNSVDNLDLQLRGKRLRVAAYEVAEELGVSESAVSTWLNGRRDTLPEGKGRSEFMEAQDRIVKRKQESAA